MDAKAAPSPPSSSSSSSSPSARPPPLWWLAERRRSRKAGSADIFGGVDLRRLQRLFRAAGDRDAERCAQLVWALRDEAEGRDAERRAQLVWAHRDEAEAQALARALGGLRARGGRRGGGLREDGPRDTLGACWLRAFNHLRIGESSASVSANQEAAGETKAEPRGGAESPGPPGGPSESHWSVGPPAVRPNPTTGGAVLNRAGESNPERYLHRIRH